jgi:precorrin-6B methylase 2
MLVNVLVILQYVFILAFLALMGYMSFVMLSFKNVVPYVPTPRKIIKLMLEMAQIKNHEKVADLGSGTGRIIIATAKRHQHNLIIGIEKSRILRLITKLRMFFHPVFKKRVQVINRDFFNIDMEHLDVIMCFLTPEALRILTPKFKTMRKGSRIVSYMFHIEDHEGFEEEIRHITAKDSVYLYTKI